MAKKSKSKKPQENVVKKAAVIVEKEPVKRVHADIDPEKMKSLMRLKPTLKDTAAFFQCSEDTVQRFVDKHFNITFFEFREQHLVHTRLSIQRKAIQKAEQGSESMIKYCLNNLSDWREKQQDEVDKTVIQNNNQINAQFNYDHLTDEEIQDRIKKLSGGK